MTKVADVLKRDANIFDSLRILAASLVIFSHSYALTGHREPQIQHMTLGSLSVRIFFVLSGLLIAASWASHPRVPVFVGKRLLRIMPGMICVIAIAALVVGPLYTSLDLYHYLANPDTYRYLNNISLFDLTYGLPGVFVHNTHGGNVNGSIWTLAYEVTAYGALALFAKRRLLKNRRAVLVTYALLFGLYCFFVNVLPNFVLLYLNLETICMLLTLFFGGVVLYVFRDRVALSAKWFAAALLLTLIMIPLHQLQATLLLTLPYMVVYVGSLTRLKLQLLSKYGDVSYGLYIYGWLVQQCVMASTHNRLDTSGLFIVSLPITLLVAFISWRLVERPALGMKRHLSLDKYPVDTTAW